jgi:uncharacterized coiled-coil protein SlyX
MPVPWVHIVRLMPSILEVSRELLKRTRRSPPSELPSPADGAPPSTAALEARVTALEENERRQAELVTTMADQLAQLTTAVTALHGQVRLLVVGQVISVVAAVVAIVIAMW